MRKDADRGLLKTDCFGSRQSGIGVMGFVMLQERAAERAIIARGEEPTKEKLFTEIARRIPPANIWKNPRGRKE